MNVNMNNTRKETTKEICAYFDKEDCLPIGTHYRKHIAHIAISITLMFILVLLSLYSLIK